MSKTVEFSNRDRFIELGLTIAALRKMKGMSQEQLAARMQVEGVPLNQKAVSRVETGLRVVSDYELMTFARVLRVTMERLVEGVR